MADEPAASAASSGGRRPRKRGGRRNRGGGGGGGRGAEEPVDDDDDEPESPPAVPGLPSALAHLVGSEAAMPPLPAELVALQTRMATLRVQMLEAGAREDYALALQLQGQIALLKAALPGAPPNGMPSMAMPAAQPAALPGALGLTSMPGLLPGMAAPGPMGNGAMPGMLAHAGLLNGAFPPPPLVNGNGSLEALPSALQSPEPAARLHVDHLTPQKAPPQQPSALPPGMMAPSQPLAAPAPAAPRFLGVREDRHNQLKVSEDGLGCTNMAPGKWAGARTAVYAPPPPPAGAPPGTSVYYFEAWQVEAADDNGGAPTGIMRLGFSTASASLALGTDDDSFGYVGTGVKCSGALRYDETPRPGQPPGSAFAPYGVKFGVGDVVGATLDRGQGTISFSVNGVDHGVAFSLPPELRAKDLFPAVTLKGCAAQLNLGATELEFPPHGAASFAEAGAVLPPPEGHDVLATGQLIGRTWAASNSVLPTYTLGAGNSSGMVFDTATLARGAH